MVRTLLVIVVVVVLGTRTPVVQMVHPGAWLAIAAVPFWWGATRHFRGGRLLIYVTAAMVLGGIWLTELAKSSHRISNDLLFSNSLTIVAIAAMIGMFLWMRTFTPEWLLTFAFGVGMLATVVITRQGLDVNPWKFALLYPVALIVMSLAQRFGGLALQALAAAVIGGISAAQDSRSALGLLALTAMLLIFQLKPQHPTRRKSALRTVVGLGLAAVVVFQLGQAAVLEGALGEATQERSQLQVEQSGSLLLGSRPEAAASFALLTARPIGYGSGTLPNLTDVLTAKTEQTKIGYDPDNGYVERYMFGSGYEVHSVLADYWLRYGLAGLAMALLIAAFIIRGLAQRIAESNASGVAIYAGAQTLWALLFAPTFASAPLLVIAVMTLLLPKPRRRLATPSSTRPLDRVP